LRDDFEGHFATRARAHSVRAVVCFAAVEYSQNMIKTVEAVIGIDGVVRLLEPVAVAAARRALVTILDEEPLPHPNEAALLGEAALADWNRPEEDAAWAHLR
jgi:hypothetical protein